MTQPLKLQSVERTIDHIIEKVGKKIVFCMPLGIGKPNGLINALYRRVKADPTLHLKILTALSLEKPKGKSDLEQRFLEPLAKRVFEDYLDMDYVLDARKKSLPPNVELYEFFMKTGDYMNNRPAQEHFLYTNYSHAARDAIIQGANVYAQCLGVDESGPAPRYSLSSNPDLTTDVRRIFNEQAGGKPLVMIGLVNRKMPFMPNDAEVPDSTFDILIDDPIGTHAPFAPPNMKVDLQDYAIALWASTLVRDGGTLQIGIGSLGDGISHALIARDKHNSEYRQMLKELQAATGKALPADAELGRFEQGLYGCSEMFVNGFLRLINAGVVRREVYDDLALQKLVSEGAIGTEVTPATLKQLLTAGRIKPQIAADDVAFLKQYGIFKPEVQWNDGELQVAERKISATIGSQTDFDEICKLCLGVKLNGYIMHGGFFIGPRDFYQTLRDMPREQLSRINMTRILFINEIMTHYELARLQRRHTRFINTTMMTSLLGAHTSDGLESGQMVSGVGGQYNFVAMAHQLPEARSILLMRAYRTKDDEPQSNVVWNYGHATIPRHLRDIVITEYGIADLRGQSDSEVIKRILAITDSRFQDELMLTAKKNRKLEKDYEIPTSQRNNIPDVIHNTLTRWHDLGVLPDFPFGTDFTDDELVIVRSLTRLKHSIEHPMELVKTLVNTTVGKMFESHNDVPERYLERMGMKDVHSFKEKIVRSLFVGNL